MHQRKSTPVIAGLIAVLLSVLAPGTAQAAPATNGADVSSSNKVDAEDLLSLDQQIDKLTAEMLAAADAANQAMGQASLAKDAALQAEAEYANALVAVDEARKKGQEVAADLYMQGPVSLAQMTLLTANGPQDYIDKAVLTDQVSNYQSANIAQMAAAEEQLRLANEAAQAAAADAEAKSAAAQQVSADTQAQLSAAQVQLDELKAQYYMQNPGAAPDPNLADMDMSLSSELGPTSGAWALPAKGTLTSCFCARWGTFHNGIDIAAPIGTPIWAAGDGIVLRSGPAAGFGLAIYIQHPNGDVTVYGHINTSFVTTGQKVKAGQHIAAMGNRGFSTGPHLHFEVQKGAYGTRVNPITWLSSRGITV